MTPTASSSTARGPRGSGAPRDGRTERFRPRRGRPGRRVAPDALDDAFGVGLRRQPGLAHTSAHTQAHTSAVEQSGVMTGVVRVGRPAGGPDGVSPTVRGGVCGGAAAAGFTRRGRRTPQAAGRPGDRAFRRPGRAPRTAPAGGRGPTRSGRLPKQAAAYGRVPRPAMMGHRRVDCGPRPAPKIATPPRPRLHVRPRSL